MDATTVVTGVVWRSQNDRFLTGMVMPISSWYSVAPSCNTGCAVCDDTSGTENFWRDYDYIAKMSKVESRIIETVPTNAPQFVG